MNSLSFYLYLTNIFKNLEGLILFISAVGVLAFLILIISLFVENHYLDDEDKKIRIKLLKTLSLFFIGLNLLGVFIPSEKQCILC